MSDEEFVKSIYPEAFIMQEKGGNIYSCYNKVALGIQLLSWRVQLTQESARSDAAKLIKENMVESERL
jgi:hypothetical protein